MPVPPFADAFVERFVMEPSSLGPLCGTRFAVKDLFDVAGRMTGCGNPSWRATHALANSTAAVVLSLLKSGARLVGKTRTDEMAYSLDGLNFHEGAPLNPAAPLRLTGGSSSGAASAVAAREVDFAIATDTAGSVRVPAAWCGVIGFRPTHARIATTGLVPLAPSFDTVGWMAHSGALMQTVGAALLEGYSADLGVDEVVIDPALDAGNLIAVAARFGAARPIALGVDLDHAAECLRTLQGAEAWETHGGWIDTVHPDFGPGVAERFRMARSVTGSQVRWAERERAALIARVDGVLPRGRILCLPSVPGPAARREATADELQSQRTRTFRLTALASLTGRPQISLPLRQVDGAPVGVSLLGWRGGDEALLRLAAEVLP